MQPMRFGIALIGTLAMLTGAAAGADLKSDQDIVAVLDAEYQLAVKKNDADTMNRILADDFVVVWGNGQTHNKAELLNDARTRRVAYEHYEDTDKTIQVWGDTAVITLKLGEGCRHGKTFRVVRMVRRYLCADLVRMAV